MSMHTCSEISETTGLILDYFHILVHCTMLCNIAGNPKTLFVSPAIILRLTSHQGENRSILTEDIKLAVFLKYISSKSLRQLKEFSLYFMIEESV